MKLQLQPVQVAAGGRDTEGQLLFKDGFLVAVLVLLSDDHEDEAGMWFLEAGFGRLNLVHPPTFVNLDKAQDWILRQLGWPSSPAPTVL